MTDNNNPPSRISVGLSRSREDPDAASSSEEARQSGHDFIILPVIRSSYKHFVSEQLSDAKNSKSVEEWRKNHAFSRDDLVIKNSGQ